MLKSTRILGCAVLCLCLGLVSCQQDPKSVSYHFDSESGSESNAGTSPSSPWKSLEQLQHVNLRPGDKILLASGSEFDTPLTLKNVHGTSGQPIVIGSYGGKERPQINTRGALNAILIQNSSFIEVSDLAVSALMGDEANPPKGMRCGIFVTTTDSGAYNHIHLTNIAVSNVFFEPEGHSRSPEEVRTPNGTQSYGWGIRVINNTKHAIIDDLKIVGCSVENVGHTGIKLTSRQGDGDYGITNLVISDNTVQRTGGPGIQMSGVQHGHIFNNTVDHSGSNDDSRKWGRGSGLWTWGSDRVLIEKNRFTNANGPKDSAGAHIDFNCSNVVMQYNFSANNAGGFCEILGNNYNCSYRYNISVNDGHRDKAGRRGMQEGKTFWLSGFSGKNRERRGPFNSYFYNNTIYVSDGIVPKMAIDRKAKGVLIANNIFHLEGDARVVKGDQWNPQTEGEWKVTDVVFRSNLFLHDSSWPKNLRLQDEDPMYGNASFAVAGGLSMADYTPQNVEMIKDQGVIVPRLAMDTVGLVYGLELERDILGNSISGTPDIGAIELP